MNEYIERNDLLKQIHTDYNNSDMPKDWSKGVNFAIVRILRQPSVDVVRCNHCKHYDGVHGVMGNAPCLFWKTGAVMWNDYCSRGEEVEDERLHQWINGKI